MENPVSVPASRLGALVILVATPLLPTLGEEEFGNKPVRDNEEWGKGVVTVANSEHRVYRRWVNGNEEFFFRGNLDHVNFALRRFGEVEAKVREVLLLPFPGKTESFEKKEVLFDWRLYAPSGICLAMARDSSSALYPPHATLTIHLSDRIQLEALEIPASVTLLGPGRLAARYRSLGKDERDHARSSTSIALQALEEQTKADSIEGRLTIERIRKHVDATRGVRLDLEFDESEQQFRAVLFNLRDGPITIVLPGEGSDARFRTPFVTWEIFDSESDEPLNEPCMWCKSIKRIEPEEILTIAPGGRQEIAAWHRIHTPGSYRIVMRYDNDPTRSLLSARHSSEEVQALIRSSDRLVIASEPILVVIP